MRNIGMICSSSRSLGRGTAVDSEKVVDSNALASSPALRADFLWISDPNIFPSHLGKILNLVSEPTERRVKKPLRWVAKSAQSHRPDGPREQAKPMKQPQLLLIDDEPVLVEFLANAASEAGFEPVVASNDREFREKFLARRPDMVTVDLGMPGMDGVELLRFLADQGFAAPVLIVSGFDRRVLESAFRLGEALGLTMAGPLEKPVRFAELEDMLTRLKLTLAT